MIWLIQDFDLLSVLLRALTLSFEALTIGGVAFLFFVATSNTDNATRVAVRRFAGWFALALAIAQMLAAGESAIVLAGSVGLTIHEIATAGFFVADCGIVVAALVLCVLLRLGRVPIWILVTPTVTILCGSVALSHAQSRLDHRWFLLILTAMHHLGSAAWIGAMPCLLVALREDSGEDMGARAMARRFSNMAVISVTLLVLAGAGMAYFYVGSWSGMYGTSYGVMLLAKIYLLFLVLALGASNFLLARRMRSQRDAVRLLMRLRRVSESEIGLGFTAILVGASLTSQPPAVDLTQDRLNQHEIVDRMRWKSPRLASPLLAQLGPRLALKAELESVSFSGGSQNDAMDQAWSEYNHHWAGLIVLAAGAIAFVAQFGRRRRSWSWAANWPLLFVGLAAFLVLRADPDAWPLGPRSFWGSFAEAEVLQHRLFAVLITAFAVFEWAIETGRLKSPRAGLVFPALCAMGGALLLTHSHALGNVKEEMLAEMSHTPIALLGATAGWCRWLELRLPGAESESNGRSGIASVVTWAWPVCLVLVGVILLDYRES